MIAPIEQSAELAVKTWREDPVCFMEDVLGATNVWDKLREIIESVRDNKYTCIKSAHNVGKSWTAAEIAVWFLTNHIGSKVILTSMTWAQVEKILWSEIRKAVFNAPYPLADSKPALVQWRLDEMGWEMFGLSTNDEDSFTGYHNEHILFIIDQAHGVDAPIWDAVHSSMTSDGARMLVIGNTVRTSGPFYQACQDRDKWNVISISALDHPNVQEKRQVISGPITWEGVQDAKAMWGEDSVMYKSRILAEFPDDDDDSVITLGMLETAKGIASCAIEMSTLGIDVARFGSDSSAGIVVKNGVVTDIEKWQGHDTMRTCGKAIKMSDDHEVDHRHVSIDSTGVGGGVIDRLVEQGFRANSIDFGAGAKDDWRDLTTSTKFKNRRAELWWRIRLMLQKNLLSIPEEHTELWSDLTAPRFTLDSAGRIVIEPKDQIKKRIGRSTDLGDALACAVATGLGNSYGKPEVIWV